jgi:hypothetical protein
MIVTVDAKRRVSIPAALAPTTPGDRFDARFDPDDDVVILRRVKRKTNWLDVWKQCPVPMDDLPPRSRQMPKKMSQRAHPCGERTNSRSHSLLEDASLANVPMRRAGGQPVRAERSGNPQRLTLCLSLWINSIRRCENPSCAPPIGRSWQAGIQAPWLRVAQPP